MSDVKDEKRPEYIKVFDEIVSGIYNDFDTEFKEEYENKELPYKKEDIFEKIRYGNFEKIRYGKQEEIEIKLKASRTPNTQYFGEVYYVSFNFKEDFRKKINPDFAEAIGFQIMPYCITKSDVCSEKLKISNPSNPISEGDVGVFVDVDTKSGNFHKKLGANPKTTRYQVVLITNTAGPGSLPKKIVDWGEEERLKVVKTDWYFPAIQSEETIQSKEIEFCEWNDKAKLEEQLKADLISMLHTITTK